MGTIHLHTLYDLPIGLKRAFSKILGIIYRNMMCQIFFKKISHFWVKITHCIWVLSQLTCWIFISHVFNYNSWNLAYFLRSYTLESPKLHNYIYTKFTFKVCTVFWIGVYKSFFLSYRYIIQILKKCKDWQDFLQKSK